MTVMPAALRLRGRPGGRVVGAVVGQLSQALGSFVLQVIAARALGASGLGTFALLYSVVLVATAISNGLVGDSLTVLDRGRPEVRSALVSWCLIVSLVVGGGGATVLWLAGTVSGLSALLFALAAGSFMVESVLRCLLVATMRFWSLAIVDLSGLVASLVVLGAWSAVASITLNALLTAWAVGQLVATAVAVACLPGTERHLARRRPAAMRQVAGFGFWRAAQQSIRPGTLTVARFLVTAAVGRAAFGQLEAARIYMAPALLVVGGLGSYLFSSYALQKTSTVGALMRRADIAAGAMLAVTLAMGALATFASGWAGHFVTGSTFSMAPLAVFGWAVYAASSAAVMPYASLAAVRGRQRVVMVVRSADLVLSVALVALLIFPAQLGASWTPYELALGSFIGAALIRRFVLAPLRAAEDASEPLTAVVPSQCKEGHLPNRLRRPRDLI